MEFVGVPGGIGFIVFPCLTLQFILCLLGQENRFLKSSLFISSVATLIIIATALVGLFITLGTSN